MWFEFPEDTLSWPSGKELLLSVSPAQSTIVDLVTITISILEEYIVYLERQNVPSMESN